MSDTQTLTLPAQLATFFEKALASSNLDSQPAYAAWSTILGVEHQEVWAKLLFVDEQIGHLQTIVRLDPHIKNSNKSKYLNAIGNLKGAITITAIAAQRFDQIRKGHIQQQHIDVLHYLDENLSHRYVPVEVRKSDIEDLMKQFKAVREELAETDVDDTVKQYLLKKVDEVLYFLSRYEWAGIDGVWHGISDLHGQFRRFAKLLEERGEKKAYEHATSVVSACENWLVRIGAIYGGYQAITAVAGPVIKAITHQP